MADRFALTVALALVTAPPVLAQAPAAPTAARYEVGGGISPFFKAFLDTNGRFQTQRVGRGAGGQIPAPARLSPRRAEPAPALHVVLRLRACS